MIQHGPKPPPRSASDLLVRAQEDGRQWTAKHILLGESYWDDGRGARWVIGERGTNIHRCEIIAGIMGSLIVHGDFSVVRFAAYGDRGDAWHRLLWMADHTDIGYYVRQKASIGMSQWRVVDGYDEEVAEHDLVQRIVELREDDEDGNAEQIAVLEEARDYTETYELLWGFLQEHDRWDLWECEFGQRLNPHVAISHVALQTCARLLRERYGEEGPPGARIQEVA